MYYYILYMSGYPLLNYNWIDISGNTLPITNSTFAYGTLGFTTASLAGGVWGSLTIPSLISNNTTLISKNSNYLTFNISGIYQLTTTLSFAGESTTNLSGGAQTFAFSYSTQPNAPPTSFSYANNNIVGGIQALDGSLNVILGSTPLFINGSASGGGSNSISSTSFGGNVIVPTSTGSQPAGYLCPFFVFPNYSTTNTIYGSNVSTITSVYYIPAPTTIYFNIGNTNAGSSGTALNAVGNFTAQLLNYVLVPSVVSSNLTGTLNYSNGYYYYTFYPTTTTNSGTATITFPTNVAVNYLLVGGGGSGAGGLTNTPAIVTATSTSWSGGGGGGGQVINSTSSISGNTFNITVGNAGPSTTASALGVIGGNTILTNGSTSAIAIGGGGGQIAPVSAGGTGGGAGGGSGMYVTSYDTGTGAYYQTVQNTPTNGDSGQTINLPFQTYNVGGGGGGGGNTIYYAGLVINAFGSAGSVTTYGGTAGSNSTGGLPGGNTPTQTGQNSVSTSYGTGGGGGGIYLSNTVAFTSYGGGQGGPGLVVLYWKA